MCKFKNSPCPEVEINLPPGALEEASKEAGMNITQEQIAKIYDDALLMY